MPEPAGGPTVDAAKEKGKQILDQSKDVAKKAEAALKDAQEDPKQAAQDFLHTPFMRAALPFINGGLAGITTALSHFICLQTRHDCNNHYPTH